MMKYNTKLIEDGWFLVPEDSSTCAQGPIKLPASSTCSMVVLKNFVSGEASRIAEIPSGSQMYGPDGDLWHTK